MTVYPVATDTAMMRSSNAGAELGWAREPVSEVADSIVPRIEEDALEVIRAGEARAALIALNRHDPKAADQRHRTNKPALEKAVRGHSSL